MKELIVKGTDGAYNLTPYGEKELYFLTLRKLIQFYLKEALKLDNVAIAEKVNGLAAFVYANLHKLDDYFSKIPDVSNFIGESNLQKFQKFMGQYFVTTLQKEKAGLIQRELNRSRDKLENPFWAPSNDMLKICGALFLKAPALDYSVFEARNGGEPSSQPAPPKAKEPVKAKPLTVEPVAEAPKKTVSKKELSPVGEMPGELFLKIWQEKFKKAPPLKGDDFIHDVVHPENTPEEPVPVQDVSHNAAAHIAEEEAPVSIKRERSEYILNSWDTMPGYLFLNRYGAAFQNSPRLEKDIGGASLPGVQIQREKRLYSLKAFAGLVNQISKFTRSKDTAGYQAWYKGLELIPKAAVKINSLLNAEKKGKAVNWGQEIMFFSASANGNKNEIYQLKQEVSLYVKIINLLRYRLTSTRGLKLNPQDLSALYSQSIVILAGKDSLEEKKAAVKMLLLQISEEAIRASLYKEYEKMIHALG